MERWGEAVIYGDNNKVLQVLGVRGEEFGFDQTRFYYKLKIQNDGNLVIYKGDVKGGEEATWCSQTPGKNGVWYLHLHDDGNLVIMDGNGWYRWQSRR